MDETTFSAYMSETTEAGAAFFTFVLVYTGFAFVLIAPLVSWGRFYEKNNFVADKNVTSSDSESQVAPTPSREAEPDPSEAPSCRKPESAASSQKRKQTMTEVSGSEYASKKQNKGASRSRIGSVLRELDRIADAEYPDRDPDFTSRISGQPGRSAVVSKTSGVSAATTSKLRSGGTTGGQRPSTGVWDVSGRRWKNRRPIGRIDVIQNAISHETVGSVAYLNRQSWLASGSKMPSSRVLSSKGMSDKASSVLEEQSNDGRTIVFSRSSSLARPKFRRGPGSISSASERSRMPSIVDDITPDDAADADDPGINNVFTEIEAADEQDGYGIRLGCLSSTAESVLKLADPDAEILRVWRLSLPLTLGAVSEPLCRLITVVFISNYLGTESMIAFLLVNLFVRLTSEQLSGAIIDSLSSFVQTVIHSADVEGTFHAGQYVQHAIVLQLLLGIPVLVAWALAMGSVVDWLVQSAAVAALAQDYTRIIVFSCLAQSLGRTMTVVFHICGYERFESIIDFATCTFTMVAVACVVALVQDASLSMVGYLQLMTGVASSLAKIAYPVLRGWVKPFRRGLVQNLAVAKTPEGLLHLGYAAFPLMIGSVLEYGEWELLTLFLKHLGPAEVVTWVILGSIWEVFESSTEGMGEAAAIRVGYLLAVAKPESAKILSYKVMYVSVIQSLLVTAGLLVFGKYLALLVTSDLMLQHMTNEVIAILGLGNATMSFAQVSWSLVGAQGRFRLATFVMFVTRWLVTMPMALICIFGFFFDLNAVSGSLVVGYSTASCVLAYFVLRSDWERLSKLMQDLNAPMDGIGLESLEDLDFSDGYDDDDSIY